MCPLVWESEFLVAADSALHTLMLSKSFNRKPFVHGLAWPGPSIPSLPLKLPRSTLPWQPAESNHRFLFPGPDQ